MSSRVIGSARDAPAIRKVGRARLAQVIAGRLASTVREGRYAPGTRLPSERDLSLEFGVSRPVLREALKELQGSGLVQTVRGRGTFVRDPAAELAKTSPRVWLRDNRALVEEFYEARLVIEPSCAERAALQASDAQLERLIHVHEAAERLLQGDRAPLSYTGLDIDFHTCIADMSGNRSLRRMLDVIISPDADLRQVLHRVPGHLDVAQTRHGRIVRAIAAGDRARARSAMTSALLSTLNDIEHLLKGGDADPPTS